jgi:CBS domain-containing protein
LIQINDGARNRANTYLKKRPEIEGTRDQTAESGLKSGLWDVPAEQNDREVTMHAMDVMTPAVISVDPNMTVQDLAKLLSERGISGAPVVDTGGRMVGIVSEGDLLHRTELGTERREKRRSSWWLEAFASGLARDYVKSHGRTVKDIMTSDVVTVTEDTELADVAKLLETNRVKRVPVLRDNKIVGIVSRANLVRALGAIAAAPASGMIEDDRAIRQRLLAELRQQQWAARVWAQDIIVRSGVVHLWFGSDEPEETRQAVRIAAENIPGVQRTELHVVPVPLMPPF